MKIDWLSRLAVLVAALCIPAYAQDAPAWPDTREARLAALAQIQILNADILASRSATLSLQKWCGDHQLAPEPRIVARLVAGIHKSPSTEQRQRLQIADADAVKYRHVELRCGDRTLSVADNWYVPARLTPEMNRILETTDTPFGIVVRPLDPYRKTIAETLLWSPLSDGAISGDGALAIPDALFEHQAVLYTRDNVPFSEVHEIYQRQILAFPQPTTAHQ